MLLLYILMLAATLCACGYWQAGEEKNPQTAILLFAAAGYLLSFAPDAALDAANLIEDLFHARRRKKHEKEN